jgi:Domain of unknown function (DUF6438)
MRRCRISTKLLIASRVIRRAGIVTLLSGCSAEAPVQRPTTVAEAPVAPDDPGSASPGPNAPRRAIDGMLEQRLCGGRCPSFEILTKIDGGAPETDGGGIGVEPPDLRLVLERTNPGYRVTIQADGTVVYEGHRFVKVHGRVVDHIDPAGLLALARQFDKAGFSFDARGLSTSPCAEWVTDQSRISIVLTRRGRELRVDYYMCERAGAAVELADEIGRITRMDRWTQCEPTTHVRCKDP